MKQKQVSSITPIKASDNKYKLGLWVRDAAAGVGTVRFFMNQQLKNICSSWTWNTRYLDTEKLLDIAKGDFVTTKIVSVIKGKKEAQEKLVGTIENSTIIGQVYKKYRIWSIWKIN